MNKTKKQLLTFLVASILIFSAGVITVAAESPDEPIGGETTVVENVSKLQTANIQSSDEAETRENEEKTFNDYFSDSTFASVVAEKLGKVASDTTNKEELKTVWSITIDCDNIKSVEGISNIEFLFRLSFSNFQNIQGLEDIGNLARIDMLVLSRNQLTKVPEFLENLENVSQFILTENQLTEFPDKLSKAYLHICGQNAELEDKRLSAQDLSKETLLPKIILQEYELVSKSITGTMSIMQNGIEITTIPIEQMLKDQVNYSTVFSSQSEYSITIKTDSYVYPPSSLSYAIGLDKYTYNLTIIPQNYVTSFTGNGTTMKGRYTIAFTGTLTTELSEGFNMLDADQLSSIQLKGTAISTEGEVGVWNQSKLTNAVVIINNGNISSITLYGKTKTTSSAWDTFEIETASQGIDEQTFSLTGNSSENQYQINLAGTLPSNLSEGVNTLLPGDIQALKLYGLYTHIENNESKFFTQTSLSTMKVTVKNGKISAISISGFAKTSNGTKESFNFTVNY